MKVLMILDANDGRGMFRHGFGLAQELAKIGYNIVIVYIDQNEGVFEEDGVKIYRVAGYLQRATFLYSQHNIRHHGPMPDNMIIRKISRIMKNEKPDLLHIHGWVLYSVAWLKTLMDVPIIATLHDYGFFCPTKTLFKDNKILCDNDYSIWDCFKCGIKYNGLLKSALTLYGVNRYFKLLLLNVDYYIAVGNYVKQRYVDAGFSKEHIKIIPNYYRMKDDIFESAQILSKWQLPEDFILFVGALSDAKGVNILIRNFKRIHTEIKLVLIGLKHSDFNYYNEENIIILENQPHDAVMEAWEKCRFGVVPSLWPDPCPTVALEAMASKKALIASDVGGLKDIVVHGETGFLYLPYDEQTLSNRMIELIENRKLAEEMGQRGYKRISDYFSIKKIAKDIEDVYKDILIKR